MPWNVVRVQSSHCPSWDLERYWGPLYVVTWDLSPKKSRMTIHWISLDGCNSFMIWHLIICYFVLCISCVFIFPHPDYWWLKSCTTWDVNKCILNNGISDNYQPQLVISSEFWAINSIITMLLSIYLPMGSMYGISTSYLLDFYGKCRQIYLDPMGYTAEYHCMYPSDVIRISRFPRSKQMPKKTWKRCLLG